MTDQPQRKFVTTANELPDFSNYALNLLPKYRYTGVEAERIDLGMGRSFVDSKLECEQLQLALLSQSLFGKSPEKTFSIKQTIGGLKLKPLTVIVDGLYGIAEVTRTDVKPFDIVITAVLDVTGDQDEAHIKTVVRDVELVPTTSDFTHEQKVWLEGIEQAILDNYVADSADMVDSITIPLGKVEAKEVA